MKPRTAEPPLILHVVFRFDVGGLENGLVNLINGLTWDCWRHAIIALDEASESYVHRIKRPDVVHVSLHKGPGHAIRLYPDIVRLCRSLRPTIMHTRNLAALEASAPGWLARVPIRIHGEHGRDIDDLDGSNARNQLVRKLYRPFVQHYIPMSQDLEAYLREKIGVPKPKISQIYNGVDTQLFRPRAGPRSNMEGCPFADQDAWWIGTVGRMQAVKAQTTLAKAFCIIIKRWPDAATRLRLILIGDGPLLHDVEQILGQAGVRHLAWLPGTRADIPQIMRALDCFVLPSLAEGISNTILEALASGLPVVATRVGGNPEIVEDGVTGRLVPPSNPEALADALITYLRAPETAALHGGAARSAAVLKFGLDRMIREYEALYCGLLNGNEHYNSRIALNEHRSESGDRA